MRFLILTVMLTMAAGIRAQNADDRITMNGSYISLPMRRGLLMEAQISPAYRVVSFPAKVNAHTPVFFQASILPEILLQMYRSESRPVKTPSYEPQIRFQAGFRGSGYAVYPYIILAHHSNGQSGDVFRDSTQGPSLNTENGSFATNFIEAGYSLGIGKKDRHLLTVSMEFHPYDGVFSIDKSIRNFYGRKRLKYGYAFNGRNITIRANYTRILDAGQLMGRVSSRIIEMESQFRLPLPKNDFRIFMNYYHGQNYYNIRFGERIRQFKMGIAIGNDIFTF